MRQSAVFTWLDSLELPSADIDRDWDLGRQDGCIHRQAKRVKLSREPDTSRLPTPTNSEAHSSAVDKRLLHQMASSSKRPRQEEWHDATNETRLESLDLISSDPLEIPRPSRIHRGTNQDFGSPSLHEDSPSRASSGLSQSSTSNHSSVSYQSSAKRQRRNAGLQETGFKPVSFELDCDLQPESLRALCQQLTKIGDGSKIIPTELRETLIGANIPDGAYFDPNDAHGLPQWRYPSLDLAQEIVTRAALCIDEGEGELSWNMDVHTPLLL
ncbi:hypothetical protein EDB80DRAFT_729123 [Ilyonectria destructans]|nr:hypothetical protein EDB80DRAFT_729123 [Ilyonectria destructans]